MFSRYSEDSDVEFIRPDGSIEGKSRGWLRGNGFHWIASAQAFSGDWYDEYRLTADAEKLADSFASPDLQTIESFWNSGAKVLVFKWQNVPGGGANPLPSGRMIADGGVRINTLVKKVARLRYERCWTMVLMWKSKHAGNWGSLHQSHIAKILSYTQTSLKTDVVVDRTSIGSILPYPFVRLRRADCPLSPPLDGRFLSLDSWDADGYDYNSWEALSEFETAKLVSAVESCNSTKVHQLLHEGANPCLHIARYYGSGDEPDVSGTPGSANYRGARKCLDLMNKCQCDIDNLLHERWNCYPSYCGNAVSIARTLLSKADHLRKIHTYMLAVEPFWLRSTVDNRAPSQCEVRHYLYDVCAMRAALDAVQQETELAEEEVVALSVAIEGWQKWDTARRAEENNTARLRHSKRADLVKMRRMSDRCESGQDFAIDACDRDDGVLIKVGGTKISCKEYDRIGHMLAGYLARQEQEGYRVMEEDLIAWYMEQIEEDIQTEAQLFDQTGLVQLIINRLIERDRVILVLRQSEDAQRPELRTLVRHPNFHADDVYDSEDGEGLHSDVSSGLGSYDSDDGEGLHSDVSSGLGFDECCDIDGPCIDNHFRQIHGIPKLIPGDILSFLHNGNSRCSSERKPEPEIVRAGAAGSLERIRELARMARIAEQNADSDSGSDIEETPATLAVTKASCDVATEFDFRDDDDEDDSISSEMDWDFGSGEEYISLVKELEGANASWDPVRACKTPEQLRIIGMVEHATWEATLVEEDFEQIVLSVVCELADRASDCGVSETVYARCLKGLGMKVAPFIIDRLQRSLALGLEEYEPLRLCRNMHKMWQQKEDRMERKRANEDFLASLSEEERAIQLEMKSKAKAQRAEKHQDIRVARLINEARQWTEVEQKWGGYEKSWEWFGDTALIAAARRGHWEVVRFLLGECLADPMLESCPSSDVFETALGLTKSSHPCCQHKRSGGLTCQKLVQRLIRAALPFWVEGPGTSAHVCQDRNKRINGKWPSDVAGLRAALKAADWTHDDQVALEHEKAAAAAAELEAKQAAEIARKAAKEAAEIALNTRLKSRAGRFGHLPRNCSCGQPYAKDCIHEKCRTCCPGDCKRHGANHGAKRRRMENIFSQIGA